MTVPEAATRHSGQYRFRRSERRVSGYLSNGRFPRGFIGNTRAKSEANTRDETWSLAVLDQLGSASAPGDVFGTGIPTFDADTGIDTSARFLYLYQGVNDGILADVLLVGDSAPPTRR